MKRHQLISSARRLHSPAWVVIACLLSIINVAQGRGLVWTGGAGNWSNPANWSSGYTPQNGDSLFLNNTPGSNLTNDIVGLSLDELIFESSGAVWGQSLTVSNAIGDNSAVSGEEDLNVGYLTLGANLEVAGFPSAASSLTLNCQILLNGHDLTVHSGDPGSVALRSGIYGQGNVSFTAGNNYLQNYGPYANNFSGSVTVSGGTLSLSGPREPLIPGNLFLGFGATFSASVDNVITNAATVQIYSGGNFLLNGHGATIYNLVMSNFVGDAAACVVDTGASGILGINGSITANNNSGNVHPTIAGQLACNGFTPISTTGSNLPGLDVTASILGNGFSKAGSQVMYLSGSNQFTGGVEVDEGKLDIWNSGALAASSGLLLYGSGSLFLGASISNKTLDVRGTTPVGSIGYGSELFYGGGPITWSGPIILDTNLAVFGDIYPLTLSGVISGPGGLEIDNYDTIIGGTGTNTFAGTVRVNSTVEFNKPYGIRAFNGPLIVGGNSQYGTGYASWGASYQNPGATLTLYPNASVHLNNNNEDFSTVTFNGGLVDSGPSGQFAIYAPMTVNPTNVSAVINGRFGLPAGADRYVIVGDGSADCDLLVNAVIIGSPSYFHKQGPGKMCLTGNNTYAAVTLLEGGTLEAMGSGALGSAAGTVISPGATLRLVGFNGYGSIPVGLELAGTGVGGIHGAIEVVSNSTFVISGNLDLDANTTIKVDAGSELRLLGAIENAPSTSGGSLTVIGGGILSLEGTSANTFSGDTTIREGTLWLNKSDSVTAVPGSLYIATADFSTQATARNLNNYQIVGNIIVYPGGTYDINNFQENTDFLALYGSAYVTTGSGYLSLKTGADVYVYPIPTKQAGISGHISLDPGNHHFYVGSGGVFPALTFDAAISQYSTEATIEKTGPGSLQLSGNNTFGGNVYVTDGTLVAANAGALGASSKTTSVSNNAVLALDGGINFNLETLVLNSSNSTALQSLTGSNSWSGPIGLYQPTTIDITSGYLQVLNQISGAGGLTKSGSGTLQFWGFQPNTYIGGTTISGGTLEAGRVNLVSIPGAVSIGDDTTSVTTATLQVDREQQFSTGANVTVHRSGQLYLNAIPTLGTPVPTIGSLSGQGSVHLGSYSSLTVSNTAFCSFGGTISGGGALTKTGLGTLQLTGTNTYGNDTTNSAGILQVDGYQPQSTIQNFARLQGSGTVGAVSMNGSSAVLAPGDSPGILNSGDFRAGGAGVHGSLEIELNGTTPGAGYDQLDVSASVALSNITLNASLNFTPSPTDTFTILRNNGTKQVFGTFTGLPQGATFNIGSWSFQINYAGGDGNDVVLTLAPPTLTATTTGGGTVIKSPDQPSYPYNSTVTLTAVPFVGYAFTGWSGDASGTQNPLTITMNMSKAITANFVPAVLPLIVDNTNATFTGSWTTDTGTVGTGFFAQDFRYATTVSSGNATATFRPNLPLSGNYDVYVWYPSLSQNSKKCLDTEYTIYSTSLTNLVSVDEHGGYSSWHLIASNWKFSQGTNGFVQLSNQSTDVNRYAAADAVMWVFSTNQVIQPYITGFTASPTNVTLTWRSGSNYTYRLQYKTNLTDAVWLDVSGDVKATNSTASKSDALLGGASRRFYRVELLP